MGTHSHTLTHTHTHTHIHTHRHTHTEIHPEQLAGWRHEFRADPFLLVMVAKFELEKPARSNSSCHPVPPPKLIGSCRLRMRRTSTSTNTTLLKKRRTSEASKI